MNFIGYLGLSETSLILVLLTEYFLLIYILPRILKEAFYMEKVFAILLSFVLSFPGDLLFDLLGITFNCKRYNLNEEIKINSIYIGARKVKETQKIPF